jgi:hypothetical protein
MRPPAPKPRKLIPGSNSGKMASALQKPKVVKPTGPVKKTSRPVTGTGTSSKMYPDLPKSTKMSESAKKVKITGSATGKKTPKPTNYKNYQKFGMTPKKTK